MAKKRVGRIRNFQNNYKQIGPNDKFYLAVDIGTLSKSQKETIGLAPNVPSVGSSFLPNAEIGPTCLFNANGKDIPDKTKPKEIVSQEIWWKWTLWDGTECEEVRYVDRERWQREHIPPPSVELTVSNDTDGNLLLVSPLLSNDKNENESLCHIANMFREISLSHFAVNENLGKIIKGKVVNVNWELLRPGKHPWSSLQKHIAPIINQKGPYQQNIINYRFETINKLEPDFVAIGNHGFQGYIVFGFSNKNLFVLESIHQHNATYVFDKNWRILSKKTKAEILHHSLHHSRIIHTRNWSDRIEDLLS